MNENTNTLKWDLQTFAEPQNEPTPEPTPTPAPEPTPEPTPQPNDGKNEPPEPKPEPSGGKSLLDQAAGTVTYDFTQSLPEGYELDEATSNAFGDICKGMNLTNDQANQLAAYGFKWQQEVMAHMKETEEAAYTKEAEETKAFFGAKFDDTMKNVSLAVNSLEREYPGFVDALNKGGVGNNKAVLQVLAKVGTLLREDPGVGGNDKGNTENNPYPNTNWDNL